MQLRFTPLATATARALRKGPMITACRHCLKQMPQGAPFVIVAHRHLFRVKRA